MDGFNLYHSVKAAEQVLPDRQLKWLDISSLCESYLHLIGDNTQLSEVHYFTAYAEHLKKKNPSKVRRHRAFVRALTARKVRVHLGHFRKKKDWSFELDRWINAYEEKETDVAIACEVLAMALENKFDTAVLVTGDSDFAPVYRCFEEHFPDKKLMFVFPFARASKELKLLCPQSFTMSKEAYGKFQLPEKVRLPSGKFVSMPDSWRQS